MLKFSLKLSSVLSPLAPHPLLLFLRGVVSLVYFYCSSHVHSEGGALINQHVLVLQTGQRMTCGRLSGLISFSGRSHRAYKHVNYDKWVSIICIVNLLKKTHDS